MNMQSVRTKLEYNKFDDPEQFVRNNITFIKQIGPNAWNLAILNRDADAIIKLFIEFKIKPNLPRINIKKILGYKDYTLIFAIKHNNQFVINHILDNYTVHPKLLVFSLITLSSLPHSPEQIGNIKKILSLSPPIASKMNNIMINAGEQDNGEVIDLLIREGGYLINRKTAMAYLLFKNIEPYEALMELPPNNHEALVQCLSEIPEDLSVDILDLIKKLARPDDLALINYK